MSLIKLIVLNLLLLVGFSVSAKEKSILVVNVYQNESEFKKINYTFSDLDKFDQKTVITNTPWTDGAKSFSGPKLETFIRMHKPNAKKIVAYAIDGYFIEILAKDLFEDGAILAKTVNGKVMRVRDRGPLWVIYPWTDNPHLRKETIYGRSIWQLNRIDLH